MPGCRVVRCPACGAWEVRVFPVYRLSLLAGGGLSEVEVQGYRLECFACGWTGRREHLCDECGLLHECERLG